MTAEQILLIILASALAVFLVLGIALIIMLIAVVQKIRTIAETVERTVENAEVFVANVQNSLAPAALGGFFMDLIGRAVRGRKHHSKEDD